MGREWSVETMVEGFAYVFNRISLGIGVLCGGWLALEGEWLRVGGVIIAIGLYFMLHRTFDAP